MEDKIKFLLNRLFLFREQKPFLKIEEYWRFQTDLEEAALNWMLIKIEEYLSLLTKRVCLNIKVWKTVSSSWKEFDVYFHIKADGREVPAFGIKTYIKFPEPGKCEFKLEDWANGARVTVSGRVVKELNKFKCEDTPSQIPKEDDYIWHNKRAT